MKFFIDDKVFETIENMSIYIIIARGIDNTKNIDSVSSMLDNSILEAEKYFESVKVKDCYDILCYREAFKKLNINPNKFMCSIEALLTRISKKKGMPKINTIVDLVNAISIKYRLPMGDHDLDSMNDDFCIRYSSKNDIFLPFGETEIEHLDDNELVYASGNDIRTRRWIWRQSEHGKVTESSKNIFFPIDAFSGVNDSNAVKARDEIGNLLKELFNCEIITGFADSKNKSIEF